MLGSACPLAEPPNPFLFFGGLRECLHDSFSKANAGRERRLEEQDAGIVLEHVFLTGHTTWILLLCLMSMTFLGCLVVESMTRMLHSDLRGDFRVQI